MFLSLPCPSWHRSQPKRPKMCVWAHKATPKPTNVAATCDACFSASSSSLPESVRRKPILLHYAGGLPYFKDGDDEAAKPWPSYLPQCCRYVMITRPSTHLASVFQRTQNCSSRRSPMGSKRKSNQYQTVYFLAVTSIHLLLLFGICSFAFCFHTLIGGERDKGRPGRCDKANDSVDDDDDDDELCK